MKNTVNLLSNAQESFHFCDLISKLFDQNQLIPIDIILSYLSTEEILSISFLTTSKLKHIMVENNRPFLASYLKKMYNSTKSVNCNNRNLFKNQIDYFSILMSYRIFEISSYFNMKHIFCKCNKKDFKDEMDTYEEYHFDSDDDDIFSESSEKKHRKNHGIIQIAGF